MSHALGGGTVGQGRCPAWDRTRDSGGTAGQSGGALYSAGGEIKLDARSDAATFFLWEGAAVTAPNWLTSHLRLQCSSCRRLPW
jgi:hypothetical protein